MKIHIIERLPSTDQGTFGYAMIAGQEFVSVERPWLNNKPSLSCIPLGTYTLVEHDSEAHPDTFALVNEAIGVYHYAAPNAIRTGILIHIANIMLDVEGCIGLGLRFGCVDHHWAVKQSVDAIARARPLMKAGDSMIIKERRDVWIG